MPKQKARSHQNHPVSHVKHPGDGFYQYVNQKWLNAHHISPWQSDFSVSDEIENRTNKELLDILSTLHPSTSKIPTTYKDQLSLLSTIWKSKTPENEEIYLKLCLNELISPNIADISKFFGWLCKSRVPTLLNFVAQEEIVPPYFARASLTPGGLTLPLNYYLNSKLQETDIWTAYTKYVTTCSLELGLPFLRHAISAEQELAKAFDKYSSGPKRLKGQSLHKWFPEFEWSGFMDGLDFPWKDRLWLLDTPDQIQSILHWICTADQEHVVAVFALHLITVAAPHLRPSIQAAAADLFATALRGVRDVPPMKEHYLSIMKDTLPDALCSIYAKEQNDQAKLNDIDNLVNRLKDAAVDILRETRVLSKSSRNETIEKIHRMRFEIGTVDPPSRPVKAVFYGESLVHTILSIQAARSSRIHDLCGKPSGLDTEYPCFQANASYYTESNKIIMPWGILQAPFYCKGASLGWNYGGIGSTIAHEITHAFDLEGIEYSPRAVYKKWWTRKNRETFKKRTRRVGKFFEKFSHYGLHIDGKKTASEDWADLGGLTIALRALRNLLDSEKDLTLQSRKEAYRAFFVSYASSWRTLTKKEKMVYSIMKDVHAPAEDRVDRIVPQFQEWIDTFDIQKTHALYVPRSERLKFF